LPLLSCSEGGNDRDRHRARRHARRPAFMAALQDYEATLHDNRLPGGAVADGFLAMEADKAARRNGRVLVAEADGVPAGFLICFQAAGDPYVTSAEKPYGWIADFFVHADHRGNGAGRALMDAAEAHFRAHGITVVRLQVLHANTRARAAYDRLGFTPYEQIVEKYL